MGKKSFVSGLDSLFGEAKKPAPEQKVKEESPPKKIKALKLKEKVEPVKRPSKVRKMRTTFVLREEDAELITAISFWERKSKVEVIEEALKLLFDSKRPEDIDEMLGEYRSRK